MNAKNSKKFQKPNDTNQKLSDRTLRVQNFLAVYTIS